MFTDTCAVPFAAVVPVAACTAQRSAGLLAHASDRPPNSAPPASFNVAVTVAVPGTLGSVVDAESATVLTGVATVIVTEPRLSSLVAVIVQAPADAVLETVTAA